MSSIARNPIIDLLLAGIAISTIVMGTAVMYNAALTGGTEGVKSILAPALAVIPVVLLSPSLGGIKNVFVRLGLSGIIWSVSRVALETLPTFGGNGSVSTAITTNLQDPMFLIGSAIIFIISMFFIDMAVLKTKNL
jgi:hypothetical protein